MRRPALLVPSVLVLLAGCATVPPPAGPRLPPPRTAPALPPEAVPPSAPEAGEAAPPAPVESARKPVPPRVLADGAQLPAVRGLLSAADAALAKGDVELAAVNLERAQRLAPQSVQVYQRLATVRLRQKRPAEAEQLARKALGYASGPAQQSSLWLVIANARQMRGLQAEAREARARAAALQQVPAP